MIRFGVDQILSEPSLKRHRLGLVTNDASRLAADVSAKSRAALRDAGFNLVRLFSPEHGIAAAAADGAAVADTIDPLTGLPVISLYGQQMRPPPQMLADLDAIAFDVPDIGARFYTYIWTLSHVMEACAEANKPLWILDRPNPLGGELGDAEGPMLDEPCASFIGRWSIPIRHSLTIGELASFWNAARGIGCELRIIEVTGWRRQMHWPDTGLPFVPTSPAMVSYETALVYPGSCLFEGTSIDEGRGTDRPFRVVGAPWLAAHEIADAFNSLQLPGARLVPTSYVAKGKKHAGQRCEGVEWQVTDPRALRPVAAALHLVAVMLSRHAREFSFEPYPTSANPTGGSHFDRLAGQTPVREMLTRDPVSSAQAIAQWTVVPQWRTSVEPHLHYG